MTNFDERAKEHFGSITFEGCIVPENVIGKDKDKTEIRSRSAISFCYVNTMVNICLM
jgi:hypothetical protein